MDSSSLQLHVGDHIQLQFVGDEHERRHTSQIIGYLPQQSLLVTIPDIKGKIMLVREGQMLIVRLLSGNHVFAFTTKILSQNLKPYPYMHLGYPEELESIVVRKSLRTQSKLVVSVFKAGSDWSDLDQAIPGVFENISTSGALIKTQQQIGDVDDQIYLSTRISVAGITEHVHTSAIIRNHNTDAAGDNQSAYHHYGVEFSEVKKESVIALHGYVYEQLLNSLG
ncbi:MAG TPA: flagellar brake protein [Gammaproteobacteria bacterium]|nr:flagellar brake protein [Gammaproteobacteria bacterium]